MTGQELQGERGADQEGEERRRRRRGKGRGGRERRRKERAGGRGRRMKRREKGKKRKIAPSTILSLHNFSKRHNV